MRPADLGLLTSVSAPAVHPGGERAVVSVTHPSLEADAEVGQLWTIPLAGHAAPRRLTRGFRDSVPRFSPAGRLLAFLRAGPNAPPQLHVVDAAGGEPVAVTDRRLGVSEFVWAPDGRTLAFVSRQPEQGRYGTVEGIGPDAEPARRIVTQNYQANGLGYTNDRRAHVFVAEVPDVWAEPGVQPAPEPDGSAGPPLAVPEAWQLTDGDGDDTTIAFSPDGATLAFVSARHGTARHARSRPALECLPRPGGRLGRACRRDRNTRGLLGRGGRVRAERHPLLLGAGGGGERPRLRRSQHRPVRRGCAGDAAPPPRRLTDSETVDLTESDIVAFRDDCVLVRDRRRGALVLTAVSAAGKAERLTDEFAVVGGVGTAGETIVVSVSDARTAGEVAVLGVDGPRQLTDFSRELRAAGVIVPRELTVTGRDGYPIHGWVVVPEGVGPHPVLLSIHGGPFASYGPALFDEAQVYASAGYAVAMCNPRGSAGYGQGNGRVIRQRMGTVDRSDVLDFLDGAVAAVPGLDAGRVGVMDGVLWRLPQRPDDRTRPPLRRGDRGAGYLDPEGFVGTRDIGSFFSDEYIGADPDRIRSQSPQAAVARVKTPTLVMHSAADLRCPLGQAERYYAALKRNGVDAELVIFPARTTNSAVAAGRGTGASASRSSWSGGGGTCPWGSTAEGYAR
ncbi:peptidase S9 [Leifsonia xyli subsp. xyli]|uniref:Acylaminoacyl-peptidase n=2 Tax=Leifsonia xyli subsp. xyli TaxID=59736 RepID=Q6AFV3_LEIXX|nr:prolyl oligopeptidase family serine peptidase [Leifsonia xyli]AAT88742.1 acylaminoacyl-peptidase [Leifsonia xyli subsp. xyli str. CTCB07]ODA91057.1 peptidase S9 [Leifsonia xyli subsp. xyli]